MLTSSVSSFFIIWKGFPQPYIAFFFIRSSHFSLDEWGSYLFPCRFILSMSEYSTVEFLYKNGFFAVWAVDNVIPCSTPFCVGCEAAQMATLPSLIYTDKVGALNEKRCKIVFVIYDCKYLPFCAIFS